MIDETLSKIKQVNQRLSDLCGLPYTDFYKADNFVKLFDLKLYKHPKGKSIVEFVCKTWRFDIFGRFDFLDQLAYAIERKKEYEEYCIDKVIRAIKREFKGLGG